MTTYRIDLANFALAGPNAMGLLAQCDASVGNLPISDLKLMQMDDGSTVLSVPALISDEAKKALFAVVSWAWADAVAKQ